MTPRTYASKILTRDEMLAERERLRSQGRTLAFTNGCFDIVHAGHVELFAYARSQGDALAVGVNSDASVKRLKGDDRPIVAQEDRVRLLAALECVDYVVVFDELHVDRLIADLLPDVLVKGEDRKDWICGQEIVEENGGQVLLAPLVTGRSTSDIVQKILQTYGHHKTTPSP